jgi:hypothetical protein
MAENGNGDKLLEAAITKWFARIILPALIVAVLSALSWMSVRIIDKSDMHTEQLIQLKGVVDDTHSVVVDHEVRIRTLERRPPRAP